MNMILQIINLHPVASFWNQRKNTKEGTIDFKFFINFIILYFIFYSTFFVLIQLK